MRLRKGNQVCFDRDIMEEREVIAVSPVMKSLLSEIKNLRFNKLPVFILGEHGSGKKFIANEVFKHIAEQRRIFLSFKCCGIPSRVAEIKLFGNGSDSGLLDKARGQALFIDGIDSLSHSIQTRLIQFFNSAKGDLFLRSTRLIVSAHSDLSKKLTTGKFQEDLFSILNKNLICLPSLKERKEDIPKLLTYFLEKSGFQGSVSPEVLSQLKKYPWPGNIIELKNLCIRWSVLHKDKSLTVEDIPAPMRDSAELSYFIKYNPKIPLQAVIEFYISQAVRHFQSKKLAGKALGISSKTIYNKSKKLDL